VAKEKPEHAADSSTDDDDDAVRCIACDHALTSRDLRCEQAGAHEHTFVNPAGFMHHIACFAAAPGCSYLGDPQVAFSWFPGWSWQIATCGRCRAHVGWLFRCSPDQFHGLIVNAIRM
jgi:hypothetical protein